MLPKLGIPLVHISPCRLSVALRELRLGKNVENDNTLGIAIAVNNKLSMVSDSGILCLLLTSMKLWQANVLVKGRLRSPIIYSA